VRSSTPPTPGVSDADLDRIAGEGRLWTLLHACEQRLSRDADSSRARLYRAAAFTGLGVPELALRSIESLDDPDASAIREAAAQIEQDAAIPPARAIAQCRRNLDALAHTPEPLTSAFGDWSESVTGGERRFYLASDTNVLIEDRQTLLTTHDARAHAESAPLGFTPPGPHATASDLPGVAVLVWSRAPWLLERVLKATRSRPQGYTPRLLIVADDGPGAVLDALAMTNLAPVLRGASTRWFFGPDAINEIGDELNTLWRWAIAPTVIADIDSAAASAARRCVDESRQHQQDRLRALVDATSAHRRSRQEWGERFMRAGATGEPALRVLLPSTRYSTYVRHAAEDLASAIGRAGDEARVLLEPERDLRPAATFELDAHAEFTPDLTIGVNWPRAARPNAWPDGAPAVCWVQDMLGPLLDPAIGAAQNELDYTAGLVNGALTKDFGYPASRTFFHTTPACPVTFHPSTGTPTLPPADVAYVSHQSATPEAYAEQLLRAATSPAERDVLGKIFRAVDAHSDESPHDYNTLLAITRNCLDGDSSPAAVDRFHLMATLPLLERRRRHVMIGWAAEICERHGLTLALYGSGWKPGPYATHARGPIEHDAQLRDCYQHARCHLHASLSTNAHQRVFECALSGGLMLRRGPSPDIPVIALAAQRLLAGDEPELEREGWEGYRVPSDPQPHAPNAGRFDPARYVQAVGDLSGMPFYETEENARTQWIVRQAVWDACDGLPVFPLEQFPDWSYDNARETLFETKDELEDRILRAVRDDAWSQHTRDAHRAAALEFNTTDAFWKRLRAFLTETLSAPSAD